MKNRYDESENFDNYTDYDDGFTTSNRRNKRSNNYGNTKSRYSDDDVIYSDSSMLGDSDSSDSDYSDTRETGGKRKGGFRKFLLSVFCILLILALILSVVGFIFLERITSKVNVEEIDEIYSRANTLSVDVNLTGSSSVKNILICGVDADNSEYGRSDSMILLSIDKSHKKIKMTSFMRDTFVYIPDPEGSYRSKLTNAYVWGGIGLTVRTIEENFGVKIDNYITVNFETFRSIVDVLGGIELTLTDREIQYINCQIAQNNQTEYLDASAGEVNLNGQQALWHARNRGGVVNGVEFYEDTDWDRTRRQRDFLDSVISDIKGASVSELIRISEAVAPDITTDMSKKELKKFLLSFLWYRKYSVSECSMPSDDTWSYEDNFAGNVIYVNDWDKVQSDLKTFIYE